MPPLPLSMWVQRTMSAEVNPSLVNWLTSMMSMRLQVILEHNPVTEQHIQHYVVRPRQVRPRDSCAPTGAVAPRGPMATGTGAV